MVEFTPITVKEKLSGEEANALKIQLEHAGAMVIIRKTDLLLNEVSAIIPAILCSFSFECMSCGYIYI